ncbi:MAG: DNA double-strand break repair nuclease NurA [Sulfolobaceae archaeon]|nr:DNA double-strand break repair nuclease NurA [Sulfolobales archaeon]
MINDVYNKLIQKKDEIMKKMLLTRTEWTQNHANAIKDEWIEYCPEKPVELPVIGVDGGMWVSETKTGAVFAVDAVAVYGQGMNCELLDSMAELGFLSPGNDAKDVVSLFMEIMEMKLALRGLNGLKNVNAELVLMDGSVVKKGERSSRVRTAEGAVNLEKIESLEESNEKKAYEKALIEHRRALVDLLSFREKVIWISKKSRSTEIFGFEFPDSVILDLLTDSCGYTKPRPIHMRYLPVPMYYSFVRLRRGSKVLRVDFSGDEAFLRRVISILRSTETKGYPMQLLEAHRKARFSKADVRRLNQVLKLDLIKGPQWVPKSLK